MLKELTASADAEVYDYFGYSVAIDGDYIIIGANNKKKLVISSLKFSVGAAYIFKRNQGGADTWDLVKRIDASNGVLGDKFGSKVTIDGEIIICTASGTGTNIGNVYIFGKDDGGADNWGEVKILSASPVVDYNSFGQDIDIDGDYVIAGAYGLYVSLNYRGTAFLFNKNQGGADNWGLVKRINASDAADNNYFGSTVSISGMYLLIGAQGVDNGDGASGGAAYILAKDQGGNNNWGEIAKFTGSDITAASERFAGSLSLDGPNAVIGARHDSFSGMVTPGSAYIFTGWFEAIPTLPEWGLIILGSLIAIAGIWFVMKR